MVIISDLTEQSEAESECFISSLQMQSCRKGCANCHMNGLHYEIECAIKKAHYDNSKSIYYRPSMALKAYLEALDEATGLLCKILLLQEPVWMAKKEGFLKNLELLLMEALRKGMSDHFSGLMPCTMVDLSKLTTLLQSALG